jgi:hypothetical protein
VGETNIRPKSVAREMCEGFTSFDDYVRDYGLQRSEGVLLRYLSQAYKTLEQNVPAVFRTDEVLDVLAGLRLILREVDSSLLDEWESLKDPSLRGAEALAPRPRVITLADDPRALAARVRADLHRVVRALAVRDYEGAARLLAPGEAEAWTPERFAEALAPYWAEHKAILTTPEARRPHLTRIDDSGPRQFRVQHQLRDPEGDDDWALACTVDLTEARSEAEPLLVLQRLGV